MRHRKVTAGQWRMIFLLAKKLDIDHQELRDFCYVKIGKDRLSAMNREEASRLIRLLKIDLNLPTSRKGLEGWRHERHQKMKNIFSLEGKI